MTETYHNLKALRRRGGEEMMEMLGWLAMSSPACMVEGVSPSAPRYKIRTCNLRWLTQTLSDGVLRAYIGRLVYGYYSEVNPESFFLGLLVGMRRRFHNEREDSHLLLRVRLWDTSRELTIPCHDLVGVVRAGMTEAVLPAGSAYRPGMQDSAVRRYAAVGSAALMLRALATLVEQGDTMQQRADKILSDVWQLLEYGRQPDADPAPAPFVGRRQLLV